MVYFEDSLRQLLEDFGIVCKKRKLTVNESKSRRMKCMRMVDGERYKCSSGWKNA